MGIITEYNPDLALRNISEFKNGKRKKEECIPEDLKAGKIFSFLKSGQRHYWLFGDIPLLETKGNQRLSRPKASIIILEATHFLENDKVYTKGKYKVTEVFKDNKIHFEGLNKLKDEDVK
ncbi:MAG: hypothetical protein A2172_03590 [Candidatus Woykebacteria bacterium RBG_13_40_15]|uniref:Uncharacterized protein n=1 Tax=Candidatus Woykebacteria bacterium RBG_13_40_15 TaxID=1802593 RepID=A0A1G1W5P8_9BACT|nr:MAG: hypothetical protein A2172_03590 [Candidatus Woykebacteria bacterium RBG_13_40_15]